MEATKTKPEEETSLLTPFLLLFSPGKVKKRQSEKHFCLFALCFAAATLGAQCCWLL